MLISPDPVNLQKWLTYQNLQNFTGNCMTDVYRRSAPSETIILGGKNILKLQKLTLASYFFLEISSCYSCPCLTSLTGLISDSLWQELRLQCCLVYAQTEVECTCSVAAVHAKDLASSMTVHTYYYFRVTRIDREGLSVQCTLQVHSTSVRAGTGTDLMNLSRILVFFCPKCQIVWYWPYYHCI